ncbi:hypothetical protein SRB5_62210 [Streptomyces sp. RB5]|uniref:Histidine kinase/HSP90-like ATPase domain-containing protein n=2 Tax=Streptomyces smaragdinus TaxID=2585196 RepID=A0A7K0CRE6_9ACTN|nr:hypothetical protein [Streptomyces smaragdinus]
MLTAMDLTHHTPAPPRPVPPTRDFEMCFTSTPRGARLARLLAAQRLDSWGIPYDTPASTSATAVVAELASNAITHALVPGRDFRLRLLLLPNTIRIELTDTHPEWLPPTPSPAPLSESGRGLTLVAYHATRWGVTPCVPTGKMVWADCALPG